MFWFLKATSFKTSKFWALILTKIVNSIFMQKISMPASPACYEWTLCRFFILYLSVISGTQDSFEDLPTSEISVHRSVPCHFELDPIIIKVIAVEMIKELTDFLWYLSYLEINLSEICTYCSTCCWLVLPLCIWSCWYNFHLIEVLFPILHYLSLLFIPNNMFIYVFYLHSGREWLLATKCLSCKQCLICQGLGA